MQLAGFKLKNGNYKIVKIKFDFDKMRNLITNRAISRICCRKMRTNFSHR